MRTSHPYSVLHLHSEGATAIAQKFRPDGTLAPTFFYQSPKATGSLDMALKRFFEDAKKDRLYINVVSETPTLKSFNDATLLSQPEAFSQVLEAHSGIPTKDCNAIFLNTKDGGEYDGHSSLLVNCFKRSEFHRAQAISSDLGFESFELFSNTLCSLGALHDWRNEFGSNETVAVLEVGSTSSVATISLADGQIISKQIPVSIQDLAESIQKKLELKFESAALLLFYNGVFDFDQHKTAISAAFGEKLSPHLQNLAGQLGTEVERLLITSLPPSYSWINEEVPPSIGLKGFNPEEFYFLQDLTSLGDCASNTGFIGTAFCAHTKSNDHPWMVPLQMQSVEVASKLYSGLTSATSPEPITENPVAPQQQVTEPPAAPEPPVAEPTAPSHTESQIFESSELETFNPNPLEDEYNPITAEDNFNPLAPESAPSITPKDPFEEPEPEEYIVEPVSDDPIEVISYDEPKKDVPPTPVVETSNSPENEEEKKAKLGLIITGIAALLMLSVGGYFFFKTETRAPAPVPLPTDVANVMSEPEPFVDSPAKSLADAEATKSAHPLSPTPRNEAEIFELADAEPPAATPEVVVEEPILPTGSLLITSVPSGASLVVNGEDKGKTPATIEELQFGEYTIEYKYEGYVSEVLNVTVDDESQRTVNSDLRLPLGTMEIHTTPEGVDFKVISVAGLDRVIHSGTTPATVPEVLEGEYEVQFTRSSWDDYSEPVVVRFNEISRVDLVYPEGWVMISSIPDGAAVLEKGQFIGKTPLRLKGLKEGNKHYTLKMEGFEDLEVSTDVVAQSEKKIEGQLLSWDREVNYNDLDIIPTQLKRTLSNTQRLVGTNAHRFLVEFVISKEGVPQQIEVLETTYLRAHERLVKDISKWSFEPGMRKENAVKTRVRQAIILGDAAKLPPTVELARVAPEDDE